MARLPDRSARESPNGPRLARHHRQEAAEGAFLFNGKVLDQSVARKSSARPRTKSLMQIEGLPPGVEINLAGYYPLGEPKSSIIKVDIVPVPNKHYQGAVCALERDGMEIEITLKLKRQ